MWLKHFEAFFHAQLNSNPVSNYFIIPLSKLFSHYETVTVLLKMNPLWENGWKKLNQTCSHHSPHSCRPWPTFWRRNSIKAQAQTKGRNSTVSTGKGKPELSTICTRRKHSTWVGRLKVGNTVITLFVSPAGGDVNNDESIIDINNINNKHNFTTNIMKDTPCHTMHSITIGPQSFHLYHTWLQVEG